MAIFSEIFGNILALFLPFLAGHLLKKDHFDEDYGDYGLSGISEDDESDNGFNHSPDLRFSCEQAYILCEQGVFIEEKYICEFNDDGSELCLDEHSFLCFQVYFHLSSLVSQ